MRYSKNLLFYYWFTNRFIIVPELFDKKEGIIKDVLMYFSPIRDVNKYLYKFLLFISLKGNDPNLFNIFFIANSLNVKIKVNNEQTDEFKVSLTPKKITKN